MKMMRSIKAVFVQMAYMLYDMLFMWMYRTGAIMCANVIPATLVNDMHMALYEVGRNVSGAIPSVTVNRPGGAVRAAQNTVIESLITTAGTPIAITPTMADPTAAYQTLTADSFQLNKSYAYPISWTGEDVAYLDTGIGYQSAMGQSFQHAFESLTNLIAIDLVNEITANASRAVGVSGTAPFSTNTDLIVDARTAFVENKFESNVTDGRASIVLNTLAGGNLRKQAQLQNQYSAGTTDLLRQGNLGNLFGFMLREEANIPSHTKGTGASATTNAAGYAVGATAITLAAIGTGTIVAGDVVTFAGDTNQYVVKTGDTNVADAGTIVLHEPGLKVAITTAATAITVTNSFTANFAIHQSAAEVAVRAPLMPANGDKATMSQLVTDPHSGLTFDVRYYPGVGMGTWYVWAVWGVKCWDPRKVVLIKG
jgi:hypothetical protein